jgi:hypothetical protein
MCAPDGSLICRAGRGGAGCLAITCHNYCVTGQCVGTAATDCKKNLYKIYNKKNFFLKS